MECRKRKADLQLLPNDTLDDRDDDPITTIDDEKLHDFDGTGNNRRYLTIAPDYKNDRDDEKIEDNNISLPPKQSSSSDLGNGFLAYAKQNPFAAALSNSNNNMKSFGSERMPSFGSFPSTGVVASSTVGGIASKPKTFGMFPPPPLSLSSPKSPKNPYSSPSPAHNPFMSIVDNNDDLWKSMAKDKLTDDEVLKSNFLDDRKVVNRKTFFGFASATTAATTTASSSSSSSSFSTNSSAYNDERLYDNKPLGLKGVAFEYTSSNSSNSIGLSSLDRHPDKEVDDNVGDDEGGDGQDEDAPATSMKIISLPENIKLITGEEDDDCLLQMRAKLYRLNTHSTDSAITTANAVEQLSDTHLRVSTDGVSSDTNSNDVIIEQTYDDDMRNDPSDKIDIISKPHASISASTTIANARVVVVSAIDINTAEWMEVGVGPLKILKHKTGIKLVLNIRLNRYLSIARQSDKMIRLICVNYADQSSGDAATAAATMMNGSCSLIKLETYLIKTKTNEESSDLFEILSSLVSKSHAAAAAAAVTTTDDDGAAAASSTTDAYADVAADEEEEVNSIPHY